jgi:hypothetical protein
VVGEDEVACFQHKAENYRHVDGRELAVVGAVFLQGRVEFLGEG